MCNQQVKFPVFSSGNVLKMLWEKARPNLSQDERQWFVRHTQGEVAHQLTELEVWLASMGVALTNANRSDSYLWAQEDIGRMFGTVSQHVGTLAALSFIGEDADA